MDWELNDSVTEVVEKHLEILIQKRNSLIAVDDYGVASTYAWESEFDYFYRQVVLKDPKVIDKFNDVISYARDVYEKQGVHVPAELLEDMRVGVEFSTKDNLFDFLEAVIKRSNQVTQSLD